MRRPRAVTLVLMLSLVLNVVFLAKLGVARLNAPPDRSGVLTEDVRVGNFDGTEVFFTLPKGLTVQDASPQGLDAIDLFEPHRFTVVVTTDREGLVDYAGARNGLGTHGAHYSADRP